MESTMPIRRYSLLFSIILAGPVASQEPIVFTFHGRDLAVVKRRIEAGDEATKAALTKLIRKADRRLAEGPFSVVLNEQMPPSGDKHDYLSQAPYWWPDPKQPDGLPYIQRDGQVNPDSEGGDDEQLENMCEAVWQLSLASHLSGDGRYADRAAQLLRVWFFDPPTQMKPRLMYGQYVPGRSTGRAAGLIESRHLLRVLDSAGLLAGSDAWTPADNDKLRAWFRDFLNWMRDSERGDDERTAENNHGTWYDAQAAAYAFFIGEDERAAKILRRARRTRFEEALDKQGRQIHELTRTRSLDYSLFNLDALMHLALLGERAEMHLWKAHFSHGRGLPKAVEWLAPYAAGTKDWPHKQITSVKTERIAILYRRAAVVYNREDYEAISSSRRDARDDNVTIALELVYPRRDGIAP
jgi:hypothetical protein